MRAFILSLSRYVRRSLRILRARCVPSFILSLHVVPSESRPRNENELRRIRFERDALVDAPSIIPIALSFLYEEARAALAARAQVPFAFAGKGSSRVASRVRSDRRLLPTIRVFLASNENRNRKNRLRTKKRILDVNSIVLHKSQGRIDIDGYFLRAPYLFSSLFFSRDH